MENEIKENYPYKPISRKQFISEYLEITKDKICWQIGCYLGSMLYIDIGDKYEDTIDKEGREKIIRGTDVIGVRDCYWKIQHLDDIIVDAWTETEEIREKIQCLVNRKFVDVSITKKWLKFFFSDDYRLICDFTNRNEVEEKTDSILQLTCENGNEYEILVFGDIEKKHGPVKRIV